MPPKKRTDDDGLGIDDLSLPKSMVARLAKGVLPANSQIQKDAMLALTRSATVFVSYIAAAANDRALLNNKKTIQHEDVFASLKDLEFEAFLPRCQNELERYQALQCTKRNDYRKRVRDEQKRDKGDGDVSQLQGNGAAAADESVIEGDTTVSVADAPAKGKARANGDRPTKKAKIQAGKEAAEAEEAEDEDDEDEVEDDEEEEAEEDEEEEEEAEEDEEEEEEEEEADDDDEPEVDEEEAADRVSEGSARSDADDPGDSDDEDSD